MDKEAKTKIKDSAFTNLFTEKKYQGDLYMALHPGEDISENEQSL